MNGRYLLDTKLFVGKPGIFMTVFRPLLAVHSSPALYLEAIRIHEQHKLSWYDSLIVAAAMLAQCETLYSQDLQDGRRFGTLQVKNPFV